jgi:hypothetical protein
MTFRVGGVDAESPRRHLAVATCAAAGRADEQAAPCLYPGTVNVTMVE